VRAKKALDKELEEYLIFHPEADQQEETKEVAKPIQKVAREAPEV
jgi:hypothetical protein